ncbi:PAS-domain containing protein [Pseudohalocynthiibacter aestuariivivens]|jgi:signal transduction histidine kinase/CheY-like chemotaxis protein|uniref:histidine kinase n=1 Tax=Pseudohalocynthiibacter aestuariivivens TaxID=1591409 RepID=A0ABV5JDK5_9RHOB|nr:MULTISPECIES: PAS-domain containing protein [Pseudohalocynthiibacter]MBS9717944.1 PAS-domain containing protein [Pseudohalocynthiibacter aestuariivivens]MCK0103116.1 PAS-domain containing protein [Pseudohalocynthiibacter sp. F2068]
MAKNRAQTSSLTQAGLNLIQQALSIYDSDLCLAVSNQRFQEIFDLPNALVTPGATFADTIRFLVERGEYGEITDPDEFIQARVDQAKAFEPHYLERTRANGQTISVEGNPLPQGGWVAVYTDITAIQQQEELLRSRSEELSDQVFLHAERLSQSNRQLAATITALEETKRQLTEMEARTRMTTEMMPAHIAHLDLEGHYTFSNRQLSAVMPGCPSNIIDLHISEALGKNAFEYCSSYLEQAFKGEPSVFEFTHQDSSRRIRVAFTPDRREGPINGVYVLSMDVTEETQTRAALSQTSKRELAAQLTSGLAHDFANLLTIILGMQSRLSRMNLPSDAMDLINATQSAARRGGNLLDRIAQMSGHREARPTATHIPEFLADLTMLARPTLPDNIILDIQHLGFTAPLLLDPGFLQDSLLNLLLNAKDAIGEQTGKITLFAHPVRDTWLEISVSDTGPGFSEKALLHALDPFFTSKGIEGSGLGLSMVYDMTKSAGGHVKLMNTEIGARVTLRLPLRPTRGNMPSRLVLLVEDSPDIRTSVREMLVDMGHSVIEAETAEEGEELAEVSGIDIILSDVLLAGGRSGDEMLQRLAEKGVKAPAHLMTSLPPTDPVRVAAASRFPLIGKPFTTSELAAFLTTEPVQ